MDQQREYFWVRCQAVVNIERIAALDEEEALSAFTAGDGDGFSLATRFAASARDTEQLLRRIEEASPDVAQYLSALDQKIELLAKLMLSQDVAPEATALRSVELSATGVGLVCQHKHPAGALVRLRMVLLPNYYGVEVLGRVVRSEAMDTGATYDIGVRFERVRKAERELIIQHVLERQSAELRDRRQALDNAIYEL